MGDEDLGLSGGSGSIQATTDDIRGYAGQIDDAGDDLTDAATQLAGLLISGDLAQAVVLAPVEVARLEGDLTAASVSPTGPGATALRMEVSARLWRLAAEGYDLVDATQQVAADLIDAGIDVLSFVAGPELLAGALVVAAAKNPDLVAALASGDKDAILAELNETAFEEPWLQELLTRTAGGTVQGLAFRLEALVPFVPPGTLTLLTGGSWPSLDYEDQVAGIIALGNLFGAFEDTGEFEVAPSGDEPIGLDGRLTEDHFLEDLLTLQGRVSDVDQRVGVIRRYDGAGNVVGYIVQIPGTQTWGPVRGDNPVDLTSNLLLEAGQSTQTQALVMEALRQAMAADGYTPGQDGLPPVMVGGHSQGGITAAAIASNPDYQEDFNITSVYTAGSPIARFDLPEDVSVLSLEYEEDVVPKLDARDNPSRSHWLTVTDSLGDEGVPPDVGAAHTDYYDDLGADLDASNAEELERWRRENSVFFGSGDSGADSTYYDIVAK